MSVTTGGNILSLCSINQKNQMLPIQPGKRYSAIQNLSMFGARGIGMVDTMIIFAIDALKENV